MQTRLRALREPAKTLASSGPSGEPMATPSVCSKSSLLNWNSWFEVAISSKNVRASLLLSIKPCGHTQKVTVIC